MGFGALCDGSSSSFNSRSGLTCSRMGRVGSLSEPTMRSSMYSTVIHAMILCSNSVGSPETDIVHVEQAQRGLKVVVGGEDPSYKHPSGDGVILH